jgi:type IV pilus assembly protein PilB
MKAINQYQIGEYLVSEGLLSRRQLDTVFSMQKSTGGSLAAIVVKMGFVEEEQLTNRIAKLLGVEYVDIPSLVIPDTLVRKIPREVLNRHQVMPVGIRGGALKLATSDPTDYAAVEEVQFLTDMPVEICLGSRTAIQDALGEFFAEEDKRLAELRTFLKSEDQTDSGVEQPDSYKGISPVDMRRALIPLLIEKGLISQEELLAKARELAE